MSEAPTDVYVFGFEDEELESWGRDYGLQPIKVSLNDLDGLSEEAPVVAHVREASEIARQLEHTGLLNDIVLYLPPGQSVPAGAFYDIKIGDEELPRLHELLAHPQQLRVRELAEDVPLRLLATPIQDLNLQSLGLPAWASEHLATCAICRQALRDGVRARMRLYQMASCPPTETLIAYVRRGKGTEGSIATHLSTCPICAAQARALREVATEYTPWLEAEIARPSTWIVREAAMDATARAIRELEEVRSTLRRGFGAVLDLFDKARTLRDEWTFASRERIGTAWDAALDRVDSAIEDFQEELEDLYTLQQAVLSGISVVFAAADKRLYIGWDSESDSPCVTLEDAHHNAIPSFSVEVRHNDEVVWSARSQQGKLTIDPGAIEDAMHKYESARYMERDPRYTIAVLAH